MCIYVSKETDACYCFTLTKNLLSVHPIPICLQRFIHYRTICDCLILRTHKINVNKHKKTVHKIDLLSKKIMLIDIETITRHTRTR